MNNKKRDRSVGDWFGIMAEVLVALVVFGFMWTQSLNFFTFLFPPEQQYLSWFGLGLTGGGMIAYFVMLKTHRANTPLKRFIVVSMIAICTLGELATAGFGVQVEALIKSGRSFTPEFINTMVMVVRVLGLFHGLALIGFFGGDEIREALADRDGNGVPDIFERSAKLMTANSDTDFPELQEQGNPTNRPGSNHR